MTNLMMISAYGAPEEIHRFMYDLLAERDIETMSISHREMPTFRQHRDFIASRPYVDWQVVYTCEDEVPNSWGALTPVGVVYLSNRAEIGVGIKSEFQRRGYGEWAVRGMMAKHPNVKRFFANINMRNTASIMLFRKLKFVDLSLTLHISRDISLVSTPVTRGEHGLVFSGSGTRVHPSPVDDEDAEGRSS